jgi:IgGFc binding protein
MGAIRNVRSATWAVAISLALAGACSSASESAGGTGGTGAAGMGGSAGIAPDGSLNLDGSDDGGGTQVIPDPTTCAEAKNGHTYLGCDFWPTVTDNIVAPGFDFAVVVANPGAADADVTVSRAGQQVATATVPGNSLTKVFLPWVDDLKSPSWIAGQPDNGCPTWVKTSTVNAPGGAYHLVSTRPVAVYQFNAIEYAAKGGPAGKDWTGYCTTNTCLGLLTNKCFSYTNDASLLLPSTALTGNYRIAGSAEWNDQSDPSSPGFTYPPYFAVTGTADNTQVTVHVSATGAIVAGGGVPGTQSGGTATFSLNTGDVVLVVGAGDLSGTLVNATNPVQVISGISCTQMPNGTEACDHLEESVLPVETLGKHYFVTVPTGPDGAAHRHVVRLYGNIDGTQLTYPGQNPGFPATINAGQMVELTGVTQDFEIVADHELTVASFQYGQGPVSGVNAGDPAQSYMVTVEQYRLKYVFLAPDDYDKSFADIVQPMDAQLILDGQAVAQQPTAISSGYGVTRVLLSSGISGAHVLESKEPVGLQVLGYGDYTSYQYPGGLNLGHIAPPPPK